MKSSPFKKLGRITVPPIPQEMIKAPKAIGNPRMPPKFGEFWFHRSYTALDTYTGDATRAYAEQLDLPPIPFLRAAMMRIYDPGLGWHVDAGRTAVINIGIQNSNTCKTDFMSGESFILEDGDVYSLNVTSQHRVQPIEPLKEPRYVLSLCLPDDYNTEPTQKLIYKIAEYLRKNNQQ